jgi:hypothetical protein
LREWNNENRARHLQKDIEEELKIIVLKHFLFISAFHPKALNLIRKGRSPGFLEFIGLLVRRGVQWQWR